MSDEELRRLERAYRDSRDPTDHAALLQVRLRMGQVTARRLAVAAALGCEGARLLGLPAANLPPLYPELVAAAQRERDVMECRTEPEPCALSEAACALDDGEAIAWACDCVERALERLARPTTTSLLGRLLSALRPPPPPAWLVGARATLAVGRRWARGEASEAERDRTRDELLETHLLPASRGPSADAMGACLHTASPDGARQRGPRAALHLAPDLPAEHAWQTERLVAYLLREQGGSSTA